MTKIQESSKLPKCQVTTEVIDLKKYLVYARVYRSLIKTFTLVIVSISVTVSRRQVFKYKLLFLYFNVKSIAFVEEIEHSKWVGLSTVGLH